MTAGTRTSAGGDCCEHEERSMLTLTVLLLVAAFICAVASLAGRVHPAVAVVLLCVLEALRVLPR